MASAAPKPKLASNKTRSTRRSGKAWKRHSPESTSRPVMVVDGKTVPNPGFTREGVQLSGRGKASGNSRKGMKVGHKIMAPYVPPQRLAAVCMLPTCSCNGEVHA